MFWILAPALSAGMVLGASPGDAAKGKEVFSQCQVCHATTTSKKKVGPSLKGLFKHAHLQNGKKVTEASVRAMIDKGGAGMPGYAQILSAKEKAQVIAYLKTL